MTSNREIVLFLSAFKRAINRGQWLIVQRRAAYAQMTEMTPSAIRIVLLTLTPNDYVRGPVEDRDRPGETLWIFHRPDGDQPYFYIKLKLEREVAKVISFHRTRYERG